MIAQTPPVPVPTPAPQALPPVPAPAQPIPTGRGGYLLPAALKKLSLSGLAPRQQDKACPHCGGALYVALHVVRLAQGYRDGQPRGTLLTCLSCGEPLNGDEVREW